MNRQTPDSDHPWPDDALPLDGGQPLDEATLDRIVARIRRHPDFLAAAFDRYLAAGGPAAGDLPDHLGLSQLAYLRLAVHRRPRPATFEADVLALAGAVKADPYRLAAVVRFADAAEAMSGAPSALDQPADLRPNDAPLGGSTAEPVDPLRRPGILAAARARRPSAGRPAPDRPRGDGGAP